MAIIILSYVHEFQTVYNVVQNPQMILLSDLSHGVSSRCEKVGMPQDVFVVWGSFGLEVCRGHDIFPRGQRSFNFASEIEQFYA